MSHKAIGEGTPNLNPASLPILHLKQSPPSIHSNIDNMAARIDKPGFKSRHPAQADILTLDGRTLEGGGQLLRLALCLAALTKTPLRIINIRGARSGGGGLKAQHLACVNWLAQACIAEVEGAERGGRTLLFRPNSEVDVPSVFKKVQRGGEGQVWDCRLDIGTAGSTGLALQAILPFILFTRLPSDLPVRITLSGGTNVSGSPSYEYISQVLLPTLHNIGFPAMQARLGKRGWSQGGSSIGQFTLEIPSLPSLPLPAFRLRPQSVTAKPSKPSHLHATFIAPSTCHAHFREVLVPAIQHHFGHSYTLENPENLTLTCENSLNEKRFYFILVATVPLASEPNNSNSPTSYKLARDWLYDRRIRVLERTATEMAERVTNGLATEWASGACADDWMRDQLVVFQALAEGRSEVWGGREVGEGSDEEDEGGEEREPSLHALTAEWVAKKMLGVKFGSEGGCEGVGFRGLGAGDVREDVDHMEKVEEDVEKLDLG